jgi:predicted dehydrogenase
MGELAPPVATSVIVQRLKLLSLSAKVFHIPFISITPELKLHSIVQRSPKPDNSAPNDHPDVKHYNDFGALLADSDVDVIIITTPPSDHFAMTKAALEAGKHVLTEKPFVPTSSEAEKLIEISNKTGKLLCVFQNRRWDLDFLTVKHLIAEGTLGRVVELNTHYDRFRPTAPTTWKGTLNIASGGSAIFDLGSHLIDQIYTLFGLPEAVHGRLLNQRSGHPDTNTPDAFVAEFTYPKGVLVHVSSSSLSAETNQPRFWVRGTKGSFRTFGVDPQEDQLKAGGKATDADFGKVDPKQFSMTAVGADNAISEVPYPQLKPETYRAFYSAFGKAVASGSEADIPVTASQARDVLKIIEAIQESAKTGKDVSPK